MVAVADMGGNTVKLAHTNEKLLSSENRGLFCVDVVECCFEEGAFISPLCDKIRGLGKSRIGSVIFN